MQFRICPLTDRLSRLTVSQLTAQGSAPHKLAVIVRSEPQQVRARSALEEAGLSYRVLSEYVDTAPGEVCAPCIWSRE